MRARNSIHLMIQSGAFLVAISGALLLLVAGCPTAGGGGGNANANDNTGGGNANANDNTEPTTGDSGLTGKFVGATQCATCHAEKHTNWSATAHAGALEALEAIGQGANPECVGCHTVGFGEEGGFVDRATTNSLAGVQCENCHGPAGDHVAAGGGEPLPTVNLAATLCGGCHTDAHHPTFDEWGLSKHATALAGLRTNSHASDECMECHSLDYRYALEQAEEHPDKVVVIPVVDASADDAAQLSLECATCHDPHTRGQGDPPAPPAQLRMAVADLCGECHTQEGALPGNTPHHPQLEMVTGTGAVDADGAALAAAFSPHASLFGENGEACAQCHVVKHEFEDPDDATPNVTGHTFNPFDEEITEIAPQHQPEQYGGCAGCHDATVADEHRTRVQAEISARLADLAPFFDSESSSFIDPEDPDLSEEDKAKLANATFNFKFVSADGSTGVHNSFYARAALDVVEQVTGGGEPVARSFVGTDRCLTCHGAAAVTGTDMSSFLRSGHPFKLNKIVDGAVPTYPFTSIDGALERIADDDAPSDDATPDPNPGGTDNTLGTPQSYADVSYVIGGFGWKSRWIDSDGYIVTGSAVQYNLETDGLVAYHNNDTDKPYNCGNCHTTGWRAYTSDDGDDRNLNRQDDLPGMAGTFEFPGVQCEACHGAGSAHASAPSEGNITRMADPLTTADYEDNQAFGMPMACGDCHTRDGEKDYPSYSGGPGRIAASGGLIKHHEQYDEMLGINPDDPDFVAAGPKADMHCTTCHNPHSTTIFQDVSDNPPGMDTECTSCHKPDGVGGKDYALTGGMADLACIDCHMPRLAKSAVKHDAVGTGPATGDIRSHIFKIDLTQTSQFTEDGSFAYPRITGEFACKTCHNGDTAFNLDFPMETSIHGG